MNRLAGIPVIERTQWRLVKSDPSSVQSRWKNPAHASNTAQVETAGTGAALGHDNQGSVFNCQHCTKIQANRLQYRSAKEERTG